MRLFAAIALPEDARQALGRQTAGARQLAPDAVRWVRPENLHVTVRFFGEVAESAVKPLWETLARGLTGTRTFTLSLGPPAWSAPCPPSVLWREVADGAEALTALHQRIGRLLRPLGIAEEERCFKAHLTLARCKSDGAKPLRNRILEEAARTGPVTFAARRLGLYRSTLTPGGPVYERLEHFPFDGPGAD